MTDILKRLNTVVTHAEYGVDPYWVELGIREIERLRTLIDNFCDADAGDIQCDCIMRECVCDEDGLRLATEALHDAANKWNLEGEQQ